LPIGSKVRRKKRAYRRQLRSECEAVEMKRRRWEGVRNFYCALLLGREGKLESAKSGLENVLISTVRKEEGGGKP